jgi:hypothetical protein
MHLELIFTYLSICSDTLYWRITNLTNTILSTVDVVTKNVDTLTVSGSVAVSKCAVECQQDTEFTTNCDSTDIVLRLGYLTKIRFIINCYKDGKASDIGGYVFRCDGYAGTDDVPSDATFQAFGTNHKTINITNCSGSSQTVDCYVDGMDCIAFVFYLYNLKSSIDSSWSATTTLSSGALQLRNGPLKYCGPTYTTRPYIVWTSQTNGAMATATINCNW